MITFKKSFRKEETGSSISIGDNIVVKQVETIKIKVIGITTITVDNEYIVIEGYGVKL
ncbi:hypothetical protein IMZ31_23675 (plasmid) [Pontibacillus sp. ALD_SL1]|uniref:hypothetical protein n=1 Tax=Pontibacillus sp. ALD_SL1 TaxID=2777185 RepID=UPI001A95FD78|nr:hypothetical protein [Pontibacillus sp. ALD_SL1]QST02452.1 hypothetical protein IMZ31_23675 [Pontibacillus sp. ALD_SL1]